MIDHADLESRLRAGLRAAADALPPSGPDGSDPRSSPRAASRTGKRRPHRRRLLAVAAGAAAVALAGAAVVTLSGDDGDDETDLVTEPSTASTTETTVEAGPGPGTTIPAGSAIVVASGDRAVLKSFGPDGQPTGELSLDPITRLQAVVSDRQGGWIACNPVVVPGAVGTPEIDIADFERPRKEGEPPPWSPPPHVYRFRPGQDPEPLDAPVECMANSMKVTDLGDRQVLVYLTMPGLQQLDLTTGVSTAVPVDTSSAFGGQWDVGGGRLAMHGQAGLQVWDLATGEPVPVGPADLPVWTPDATSGMGTSALTLSPDGTMVAAMVGDTTASSDVVVIDLASGTERLRRNVPVSVEGADVAFDGTSVAVSSFYDSYGATRIYDVATGAERTVDAHGLLP